MADYASIIGGNGGHLAFDEVPRGVDAFYHVDSAIPILDLSMRSGDSHVDGAGNANPLHVLLGRGDDTVHAGSGEVVAAGVNLVLASGLSSMHAEVVALSVTQARLGTWDLGSLDDPLQLWVNWRPCAMCYGATLWSGVRGLTVAGEGDEVERLTGFDEAALSEHLSAGTTFEDFFAEAQLNPNVSLITGSVCGVRVEAVEDPLMRRIRYLDKLVDELAKGRPMEKILRA